MVATHPGALTYCISDRMPQYLMLSAILPSFIFRFETQMTGAPALKPGLEGGRMKPRMLDPKPSGGVLASVQRSQRAAQSAHLF